MATSYANDLNFIITTVESMPLSEAITGSVSVTNTSTAVTGVGTVFLTEIGGGNPNNLLVPNKNSSYGFLWDYTNTEYRKIMSVESDTLLFIEKPFTNNLVGSTVKQIPSSRLKMITWDDHSGSGGGLVNGLALAANESSGVSGEDYRNTVVDPIMFDGQSGAIAVTISYV